MSCSESSGSKYHWRLTTKFKMSETKQVNSGNVTAPDKDIAVLPSAPFWDGFDSKLTSTSFHNGNFYSTKNVQLASFQSTSYWRNEKIYPTITQEF